MKRLSTLLVLAMLCVASILAETTETTFTRHTFTLGQTTLPYRKADIGSEASAKPAVLLYLHGGTVRGDDNETQLTEPGIGTICNYIESNGLTATVLVPQCPAGGGWNTQLARVLYELVRSYAEDGKHDASRIYVVGGSMGGTGTWTQLSRFPDFYAAAMPVAGNPTGLDAANVATTPVRTVMGTADVIMSIDNVTAFKADVVAAGGTLILDIEQGWSHQNVCEHSYTDDRLAWLFAHIRNDDTGIGELVGARQDDTSIYDLSGRRVATPAKGIYISNGKKYIR